MPMMPYVSPEQAIKDKADFARKGISRGRSVVALTYTGGLLFVAENPSATLHKVSEIYDRIAFAGAGRYNEYEQLRIAGIRLADSTGYTYSRADVTGRTLANAYANAIGGAFTDSLKPLEIELLVAELTESGDVELYHILYDGSITDEENYVAIGGRSDAITEKLGDAWEEGLDRDAALRVAKEAFEAAEDRTVSTRDLEVAGLDSARGRRKFFRLTDAEVHAVLGGGDAADAG